MPEDPKPTGSIVTPFRVIVLTPATGMKGPKSGWTFRRPFRFPRISLGTIRAPPSIKGVKTIGENKKEPCPMNSSFSEFPGRIGPAFDRNEITFIRLALFAGTASWQRVERESRDVVP